MTQTIKRAQSGTATTIEGGEQLLGLRMQWAHAERAARAQLGLAQQQLAAEGATVNPLSRIQLAYSRQAETATTRAEGPVPVDFMTLAILSMPSITRAHSELRRNPNNPKLKARMIRFNHEVQLGLGSLDTDAARAMYRTELLRASQAIFDPQGHGDRLLPNRDYEGIMDGIYGEFAVIDALQTALPDEWEVEQSTSIDDIQGNDLFMVSEQGTRMGVDTKAAHSFDESLKRLLADRQITPEEYNNALEDRYLLSYPTQRNGHRTLHCMVDFTSLGAMKQDRLGFRYPVQVAGFFVELIETIEEQAAPDDGATGQLRKLGKTGINR